MQFNIIVNIEICHLYMCKLFCICVNLYLYLFFGSFSTRLTALCIIIIILIIVLISLVSLFKTIDSTTFSRELIDYQEDPLLSDPKRLKGSKTEYLITPCDRCEYSATITRCINHHIESRHEGARYSCDKCEYAALQQVI